MGFIEEMRWWHWIVLSLILGVAIGYINGAGNDAPASHRAMDPTTFEEYILRPPVVDPKTKESVSWISDVMVYPPGSSPTNGGQTVEGQLVTYLALTPPDEYSKLARLVPYSFIAPIPYEPKPRDDASDVSYPYPGTKVYVGKAGDTLDSVCKAQYGSASNDGLRAILAANDIFRQARSTSDFRILAGHSYFIPWNPAEKHTVADFLADANKHGAHVKYTYIWWRSPKYAIQMWTLGSFLVIGLAWPALIQFMLRGGLGRPEKKKKREQRRYVPSSSSSSDPKKVEPLVTSADMAQLQAMEQSLIASIKAGKDQLPQAPAAAAGPAAVKQLSGGPAEPVVAPAAPEEPKDYKGEYYPVARPSGKGGHKPA